MPSEIGIQNILSLLLVETVNLIYVKQTGRHLNFSGQKICMYAVTRPTLLKSTFLETFIFL